MPQYGIGPQMSRIRLIGRVLSVVPGGPGTTRSPCPPRGTGRSGSCSDRCFQARFQTSFDAGFEPSFERRFDASFAASSAASFPLSRATSFEASYATRFAASFLTGSETSYQTSSDRSFPGCFPTSSPASFPGGSVDSDWRTATSDCSDEGRIRKRREETPVASLLSPIPRCSAIAY
jgi:hypothetical protein